MKRGWFKRKRRNKFGAVRTKIDGIWFDSKLEATGYLILKDLLKQGCIKDLELQKEFPLHHGDTIIGHYRADFFFYDLRTNQETVFEAKGKETDLFSWKWRHMKAEYPQYKYTLYKGKLF